ncbi:molybdopterin cofactor-binding domain-containing protein [Methylomonas sp. CM2]|uniref:molybdopterin cofactor-binding domain-containing protein n=1 Tax=Methylomonas sp. CM2 TaxID=3417647 RepID=UPI003CFBAE58
MNRPFSDRPGDALSIVNVSRREFLKTSALTGFVLAAGFPALLKADETASPQTPAKYGADAMPHGWIDDPLVFVAIAADGTVTIVCHRSEMGQGVRTSLPMVVADELEADWARVRVEQAPGDEVRFGNQDTDGSRSTRHFSYRCAGSARRPGACWKQRRRPNGGCLSKRCAPSSIRSNIYPAARPSATANWPRRRRNCRCLNEIPCD